MPPPVYVAFLVCLLGGAFGSAEAVEVTLRSGSASGDSLTAAFWAVINFWVAWGLNRGATTAKMLVEISVVLTLFGAVLVAGLGVLSLVGPVGGEFEGGVKGAILLCVYTAVAFYLWRGMHSPEATDWFGGGAERLRERSPAGFRLRTLMTLIAVFAVAFASTDWQALTYDTRSAISTSGSNGKGGVTMFSIGARDLRSNSAQKLVDFVVMESSDTGKLKSRVMWHSSTRTRGASASVSLPSGTFLSLPGEVRLIEIHGDNFKTSTRGVTWPQLDGYMHSNPETPTIDGLLAFEPELADE